LKIENYNMDV